MKKSTTTLILVLFIFTGFVKAQTVSALITGNGKYLIAENDRPPLTRITIKELTDAQKILIVNKPDLKTEPGSEVSSFKLTVISSENVTLSTDGNTISEEMKLLLNKCVSGNKIYFEYIKVKGPGETIRSLSSMGFQVM